MLISGRHCYNIILGVCGYSPDGVASYMYYQHCNQKVLFAALSFALRFISVFESLDSRLICGGVNYASVSIFVNAS